MQVRWTDGLKAGEVAEVEDSVAYAYLNSGKAERVETAEADEVPEKPKRRRRAAAKPEGL